MLNQVRAAEFNICCPKLPSVVAPPGLRIARGGPKLRCIDIPRNEVVWVTGGGRAEQPNEDGWCTYAEWPEGIVKLSDIAWTVPPVIGVQIEFLIADVSKTIVDESPFASEFCGCCPRFQPNANRQLEHPARVEGRLPFQAASR